MNEGREEGGSERGGRGYTGCKGCAGNCRPLFRGNGGWGGGGKRRGDADPRFLHAFVRSRGADVGAVPFYRYFSSRPTNRLLFFLFFLFFVFFFVSFFLLFAPGNFAKCSPTAYASCLAPRPR
jgi:hypothetical protein